MLGFVVLEIILLVNSHSMAGHIILAARNRVDNEK